MEVFFWDFIHSVRILHELSVEFIIHYRAQIL